MKNITRTFVETTGTALVYNQTVKGLEEIEFTIDGKFDVNGALKELSKRGIKALDIDGLIVNEKLYGMTQASFIEYAHTFDSRGKDNRGMVSKTISVNVYTCKCYDTDQKVIVDKTLTGNSVKEIEKNLPTNFKLLEVVDTEKVESLMCMSVKDFKRYARPMIDHFHFED